MPQIVRTPEDIFRAEGKDIYIIRFADGTDMDASATDSDARREILAWITDNEVANQVEPIGFSEYSGLLGGSSADVRIDFTDEGLARFHARWEDSDGKSLDPRFQCYLIPYLDWFEKHGRFKPTNVEPSSPGITVWIDTPLGFIYNMASPEDVIGGKVDSEVIVHPAHPRDLWTHAVQQWPELRNIDIDDLPYGTIYFDSRDRIWNAPYSARPSGKFRFDSQRQKELLRFFKLPENTDVFSED